jgi:hypothetical protein
VSTVTDYAEAAEQLGAEYFLGRLVMFTISNADVELEKAKERMDDLGLQTNTLRKRLRNIDAFKKATNDVAKKFSMGNTHHAFLVRAVGKDDAVTARRHIVLERAIYERNKRRHLLYDEIVQVVYDRGTRQKDGSVVDDAITVYGPKEIVGYDLTADEKKWLDAHVGDEGVTLIDRFEYLKTHMDSHAVRTAVRDYIVGNLQGILVKENGGLYFVQEKHAEELIKLQEWVSEIGSSMHTIPLLNITDQREMLIDAYEREMLDRATSVTTQIDLILSSADRTVTQETFDEFVGEASKLLAQTDDYAELLDNKLDTARVTLEKLKMDALRLASRVKTPKRLRMN